MEAAKSEKSAFVKMAAVVAIYWKKPDRQPSLATLLESTDNRVAFFGAGEP